MSHSRRTFLCRNITAATSCAAVLFGNPLVTNADENDVTRRFVTRPENGFDPIQMHIHQIEDKFYRHWILGQAAQILHTNFRHVQVAKNAYNIPSLDGPPAYFVDDGAYARSNIAAHPTYGAFELLWYQLSILRLPNSAQDASDEGPPFPPIHIYPMHEENEVHGRAEVGIVDVKYVDNQTVRRTGEFKVQVNLFHLGADGKGSSPAHWATVIAHEMLHNLGHKHNLMEYVDGRQINAFHRAVGCGGTYNGSSDIGHFGCRPTI